VSRATRDRALEIAARFREPESLAVTLTKILSNGADGVLLSPSQQVRLALDELEQRVPIYALLPNVPEYVRDSSDVGLAGAAIKRVKRATPGTLVRLGLTGVSHALGVLAGDFAAMVPILLELESAALGARHAKGVVIAAPITDLALAGRHRRFFQHLTRFMRNRFGGQAAFETHNLGHLLRALREWQIEPDFVIGPVNPRGLMMKPSVAVVEEEIRRSKVPVLAKELRAGGVVTLAEGVRYARAAGVYGLAPDLIELENLAEELRELHG
jgi:hypothetical protein